MCGDVMKNNEKNSKLPKIYSITGLKVIVLLCIFIWHWQIVSSPDLGARGCELMFICSGFCIAYNYYNKQMDGTIFEAFNFAKVRLKKFYVLYIITMLFALLWLHLYRNFGLTLYNCVQFFFNVTLTQIFFGSSTFNGASWFLTVLLFCYFCTPFILAIIKKCDKKKLGLLFLFLFLLLLRLFLEYINLNLPPLFSTSLHTNPFIRLLEYFISCIAGTYFLLIKQRDIKINIKNNSFLLWSIVEVFVVLLYVCLVIYGNSFLYRGFYSFLGLILVFVIAFQKGIVSSFLSNKLFLCFAKYELEFYLVHRVVIFYFENLSIPYREIISFIVMVIIAIVYKRIYDTYNRKFCKNV